MVTLVHTRYLQDKDHQLHKWQQQKVIARWSGCSGQAANAVSAYTQVKMEDAPRLLEIPRWKCPDNDLSYSLQVAKITIWHRRFGSSWTKFVQKRLQCGRSWWNLWTLTKQHHCSGAPPIISPHWLTMSSTMSLFVLHSRWVHPNNTWSRNTRVWGTSRTNFRVGRTTWKDMRRSA